MEQGELRKEEDDVPAQVPGPESLGHFTLLLDEELAAVHETQRQNKNRNRQS